MRSLILCTAAVVALAAAPAFALAQAGSGYHEPGSGNSAVGWVPNAPPAPDSPPKHSGKRANDANTNGSPVSGRVADAPSAWTGSSADWQAHAQACSARYSSYDMSTDMYTAKNGKQRMCMVAMGGAR
jgi:hypothetical protein